jgi:DNA-binding transcriptional LysR family regulator
MGVLGIGATLSIGNYLAVSILSDFKRRYPKVTTRLEVENTSHIVGKVLGYELDIGLIEGEIAHPELEVTPWRKDELVVFCAPDSPWPAHAPMSDEDLCRTPWVLREPGSGTRQTFDHAMHGLLSRLDIAMELQHTEAIKRAVEKGAGVGCLSRITLEDAFRRGSLVPLKVPQRDFSRMFYFIERRNRFQTALVQCWRELCLSC